METQSTHLRALLHRDGKGSLHALHALRALPTCVLCCTVMAPTCHALRAPPTCVLCCTVTTFILLNPGPILPLSPAVPNGGCLSASVMLLLWTFLDKCFVIALRVEWGWWVSFWSGVEKGGLAGGKVASWVVGWGEVAAVLLALLVQRPEHAMCACM